MHVHAHAGTRVHEATSLTGLVPERVQLTVHTTEPTGTVPEPFHCDHIARWSARSGTSGRSGTGLNTGNWNGSGTVLVSNLWCEHGLSLFSLCECVFHVKKKEGKGSFYIAQYPVRWTTQSALHFLPSLTDLFIPTPTRLLREAFQPGSNYAPILNHSHFHHCL